MRFLPVFLDLQAGPVVLVGAGDLARAKLRLLAAAGARVRWYATDGHHDPRGLEAADAEVLGRMVRDPHPGLREHAVRIASGIEARRHERLLPTSILIALAGDPALRVRLQAALALGDRCHDEPALPARPGRRLAQTRLTLKMRRNHFATRWPSSIVMTLTMKIARPRSRWCSLNRASAMRSLCGIFFPAHPIPIADEFTTGSLTWLPRLPG